MPGCKTWPLGKMQTVNNSLINTNSSRLTFRKFRIEWSSLDVFCWQYLCFDRVKLLVIFQESLTESLQKTLKYTASVKDHR